MPSLHAACCLLSPVCYLNRKLASRARHVTASYVWACMYGGYAYVCMLVQTILRTCVFGSEYLLLYPPTSTYQYLPAISAMYLPTYLPTYSTYAVANYTVSEHHLPALTHSLYLLSTSCPCSSASREYEPMFQHRTTQSFPAVTKHCL